MGDSDDAITRACKVAVARTTNELQSSITAYGCFVVSCLWHRSRASSTGDTTAFHKPAFACTARHRVFAAPASRTGTPRCTPSHAMQMLMAAVAIFTSAYCVVKWRKVSTYLWKLYGLFAATMCAACCCTFIKVAAVILSTQNIARIPSMYPPTSSNTPDMYVPHTPNQCIFFTSCACIASSQSLRSGLLFSAPLAPLNSP